MSECVCVLCVVEEGWMRVEQELHDSCMAVGMVFVDLRVGRACTATAGMMMLMMMLMK